MIYVLGIDTDATFRQVLSVAYKNGVRVQPINLRAVVERGSWRIDARGAAIIEIDGEKFPFSQSDAFFCRLISLARCEVGANRVRWQNLHDGLLAWLELTDAQVVNRPGAGCDNACKPLHEWILAREGLAVPPSITTSLSKRLITFTAAGPTVAKTICGVRASCLDVNTLTFEKYDPRRGPVHLQRKISGYDVRVHVVGDNCFSVKVDSPGVDYRDTAAQNSYSSTEIPERVRSVLVRLTRKANLCIAGWDFKVDNEGRHWCLECNPMPGFDEHDRLLGGSITAALLSLLSACTRRIHLPNQSFQHPPSASRKIATRPETEEFKNYYAPVSGDNQLVGIDESRTSN